MTVYSKELSEKYTINREQFTATNKKVFSILQEIGLKNKQVLDHGCGDGRFAFKLLELGAESVVGIDNSPSMIQLANDYLGHTQSPNIQFIEADGNALPFENESFDVVFSNFVFHHFRDIEAPLKEIERVLKSNGHLVATFNTMELNDDSLYNTEVDLKLGQTDFVIVHNLAKTDDEIASGLKAANLKTIQYSEEENPFLSVDPDYSHKEAVRKVKTMLLVTKK